jgi:hypothetical protein
MLVLLDEDGCPVAVAPSPWAKVLMHVRAWRLDADLAGGASPDSTVALALRAQLLVRNSTRRELARGVQHILSCATGECARSPMAIPVILSQVRACSCELNELLTGLLADGPVSPQGMARVRELLTAPGSPLYDSGRAREMRVAVLAATDALRAA